MIAEALLLRNRRQSDHTFLIDDEKSMMTESMVVGLRFLHHDNINGCMKCLRRSLNLREILKKVWVRLSIVFRGWVTIVLDSIFYVQARPKCTSRALDEDSYYNIFWNRLGRRSTGQYMTSCKRTMNLRGIHKLFWVCKPWIQFQICKTQPRHGRWGRIGGNCELRNRVEVAFFSKRSWSMHANFDFK